MNQRLISSDNWLKDIKTAIHDSGIESYRRDAVVMLDGLYTASAEFFKNASDSEIERYFEAYLDFHKRYYGIPINAVLHLDEATPHLHVCSVPLIKNAEGRVKLSAKEIMGNKHEYHQKQNMFYDEVSSKFGLERGTIHESVDDKKEHLSVLDYKLKKKSEEISDLKIKLVNLANKYNELVDAISDLDKKSVSKAKQILMSKERSK